MVGDLLLGEAGVFPGLHEPIEEEPVLACMGGFLHICAPGLIQSAIRANPKFGLSQNRMFRGDFGDFKEGGFNGEA